MPEPISAQFTKKRQRLFQLRLRTALALMVVAGALLWVELRTVDGAKSTACIGLNLPYDWASDPQPDLQSSAIAGHLAHGWPFILYIDVAGGGGWLDEWGSFRAVRIGTHTWYPVGVVVDGLVCAMALIVVAVISERFVQH